MSFNPSTPSTLGPEWLVTGDETTTLSSSGQGIGWAFTMPATETIDTLSVYVSDLASFGIKCEVEVMPLATAETATLTPVYALPNEDVVETTLAYTSGTDVHPLLDEALGTPDDTNYISANASTAEYAGRVGTSALVAQRIFNVELILRMYRPAAGQVQYKPYLSLSGVKYYGPTQTLSGGAGWVTANVGSWPTNPSTLRPWTVAEAVLFDTTDEWGVEITVAGGAANSDARVSMANLVFATATENRVLLGSTNLVATGWATIDLSTPGGVASASMTSGTDYLVVLRKISTSGSVTVRALDSGVACPHAGFRSYRPSFLNASGWIVTGGLGSSRTAVPPLLLTTTAPATSTASQPYVTRTVATVHSSSTVEQEITFPGTLTYGFLQLVAAAEAATVAANLTVKLKRRSDGVQIGSTITFASADLTGTKTAPRLLTRAMDTPTAVTAAQHYLEFTSTAATGGGWVLYALDTKGSGNTANFGGTTDRATIATVESSDQDIVTTLGTVPSAPAGFTAVVV